VRGDVVFVGQYVEPEELKKTSSPAPVPPSKEWYQTGPYGTGEASGQQTA
jgi:hypothetical protein